MKMIKWVISITTIIVNITVIWLFYKNYLENKIKNRILSLEVKDKIEEYRVDLLNEKIKTKAIIIKDVFTNEELGITEFADTNDYMVEIITGLCEEMVIIGYIPYTNIISFDKNISNERGSYILWCKFNNLSKFYGINPYTKMSYCKRKPKSNDGLKHGYDYVEVEELNYNVFVSIKNRISNFKDWMILILFY